MLNQLLQQLEAKIDDAMDTIQLLVLENDELKDKLASLETDNNSLKSRQVQWEQNLSAIIQKLNAIDLAILPKENIFKPSSTTDASKQEKSKETTAV